LDNYVKNKVEKVEIPESKGIEMGIKISTGFQKCQDVKMASNKLLKSTLKVPIAVLHIHYRPICWLQTRNILLDDTPLKIEKVIKDEFEVIKTEEKKIKVKREFSEVVETEESKKEVEKKIKIEHHV
jgi:hypothetical protein